MGLFGFGGQQQAIPTGETQKVESQNQIPFYQRTEELGKEMLNIDRLIYDVRLQLLGFVEVKDDEYKQIGEKLMNDKGAAAIVSVLRSHIGKEVFLSKISDYDKVRIIKDLWATLIMLIVKNRKEWDLSEDSGKWRIIREIVINQAYFALCRAVNGTEKGFFADVYQEKQIMAQNSQQQFKKSGWLGG